jgi:hypothetical protein
MAALGSAPPLSAESVHLINPFFSTRTLDANHPGHDPRNARINLIIRRIQPWRPEQTVPAAVVRKARRERPGELVFNMPFIGRSFSMFSVA